MTEAMDGILTRSKNKSTDSDIGAAEQKTLARKEAAQAARDEADASDGAPSRLREWRRWVDQNGHLP